MPQLMLTPGEGILMQAALKRRLAELGRPGPAPEPAVTEVERITRLLQQINGASTVAEVRVMASSTETELMAQSLRRGAAWQRSLLPHARNQGVLATLCRKVDSAVAQEASLPERLARHMTSLLQRGDGRSAPPADNP